MFELAKLALFVVILWTNQKIRKIVCLFSIYEHCVFWEHREIPP